MPIYGKVWKKLGDRPKLLALKALEYCSRLHYLLPVHLDRLFGHLEQQASSTPATPWHEHIFQTGNQSPLHMPTVASLNIKARQRASSSDSTR